MDLEPSATPTPPDDPDDYTLWLNTLTGLEVIMEARRQVNGMYNRERAWFIGACLDVLEQHLTTAATTMVDAAAIFEDLEDLSGGPD